MAAEEWCTAEHVLRYLARADAYARRHFAGDGFEDVDCYWKWLEMALLVGIKPTEPR